MLCGWTTTSMCSYVDIVQPVRLDDLQALVHERGRVDGDLGAHAPGGMGQRIGRGAPPSRSAGAVAERPARCRQDQARDIGPRAPRRGTARGRSAPSRWAAARPAGWPAARPHRGGRGARRAGSRQRHHQVAAGDERLLVGRGHDLARCERRDDRAQAHDTARGHDHEVHVRRAWPARAARRRPARHASPAGRVRPRRAVLSARATVRGCNLATWSLEAARVAPGREGHDLERVGQAGQHLERLPADRAGRAEQRDPDRRRGPGGRRAGLAVSGTRQGSACRSRPPERRR